MTNNDQAADAAALARHDRQVSAISSAVARLLPQFGPKGFTPEAIFEGAVKGAAVAIMAGRDLTATDVAELLADLASAFRESHQAARAGFHVVEK